MDKDGEKQAVARAGLNFIQDGQVVGLGSGSTSAFFIQFLGDRVRAGLQIRGIPTSMRAQQLAEKYGIRLATLDEISTVDVDVDGADEFDPQFQLIKGRWWSSPSRKDCGIGFQKIRGAGRFKQTGPLSRQVSSAHRSYSLRRNGADPKNLRVGSDGYAAKGSRWFSLQDR